MSDKKVEQPPAFPARQHDPTDRSDFDRRGCWTSVILCSVLFYTLGLMTMMLAWRPKEAMLGSLPGINSSLTKVDLIPLYGTEQYHSRYGTTHLQSLNQSIYPPGGGIFMHKPHYQIPMIRAEMTVFHQLHCIDDLARYINTVNGSSELQDDTRRGDCLEYLRRTVMCAVDTYLEHEQNMTIPARGNNKTDLHFGHKRVCRDLEQVRDIVRELEKAKEGVTILTVTNEESAHLPFIS